MYITPTPHNEAALGEIAKTVLMPGDPLRAKEIADGFLENYHCVNTVRNMLAYTGTYRGKTISVMGSGMGTVSYTHLDVYKRQGPICLWTERVP